MNDPVFHGDLALLEKLSGDALSSLHLARRATGPVLLAVLPVSGVWPPGSEAAYLDAAEKLQGPRGAGLLTVVHAQGGPHRAVAHALFNGTTLSEILEKARQDEVPMAADLSLLVAEKIAESLKQLPSGLRHTLISAECVLINYEGEITVMDAPLAAALAQQPLTEAMTGETRFARLHKSVQAGKPSPRAEIWQLGAMLLEMVSGEPFTTRGDIAAKIVQQCNAQEIGADIREVIERALVDNSDAYRSIDEFREAAGKLIYQGAYAPSTFNLAFFMHTLYRGEDEIRAAKVKSLASLPLQFPAVATVAPAPAVPAPAPAPKAKPAPPKTPTAVPTFGSVTGNDDGPPPPPLEAGPRAGLPMGLIAGGVIVLLALLGGGFMLMRRGQADKDKVMAELQAKQLKLQQENEKLQLAAHEADDLKAQKAAADRAALDAKSAEEKKNALDEQTRLDAKLKAAEERRRVQEEAVKKQTDVVHTAETRKPAPSPAEAKSPPAAAGSSGAKASAVEPPPVVAPAPAPAVEPVKEIYTAAEVDSPAKVRDDIQPDYPGRGRGSAVVILRLIVDAAGGVVSAEIAKSDDGGYGFNEAAMATAKKLRYAPAIKDGRPVKSSVTKTYKFKG